MRAFFVCLLVAACGPVERAAAKDPMRCERDPACAAQHGKSKDCATQCADNLECMQRCEAVQGHR